MTNLKNPFKLNADRLTVLFVSAATILIALFLANRFNARVSMTFLVAVLEVGSIGTICTDAIKDLLVSRYFVSKGQTRYYSSVNLDSKGILLLAAFGCAVAMTIDVIVFGIAAALILIFSVLIGRSLAKDEIAERTLISEMTEDQKNFRSGLINEVSDLMSRNSFERYLMYVHAKQVGSIDYCVNYLPINLLMKDLEELKSQEHFNLLDSLTSIAADRSTERRENSVLSNAIQSAKDKHFETFEDYRKYFN